MNRQRRSARRTPALPSAWNLILVLSLALFLSSCSGSNKEQEQLSEYSFFVGGHAYGNPNHPQYGLYPPLVKGVDSLISRTPVDFGVLTGDVVVKPTTAYWDSAQKDIDRFHIPIHIAAGNHDKGEEFEKRFGDYYYSFSHRNDLFIVLAPENWNISGEQLAFLRNTLAGVEDPVNNVFIFCHELIFWHPENEFGQIDINWKPHFPGETNYLSDVKPILDSVRKPIFFITGDIGATSKTTDHFIEKQGNITFIGSGVGSGAGDNLVVFKVAKTGIARAVFLSLDSLRFLHPLENKGLKEIH
jgi:hypothetical protein